MKDIEKLIDDMTLEEKASMCSGVQFWFTQEIKRLGIEPIMVSDGPVGLRKQNLEAETFGVNNSIEAVCFPTSCGVAASFNKELINYMGVTHGKECIAENVSVILGPAVNIKRSPLCGRNFEYLSEDPCVAADMATAYIKGVQSQGIGNSIKHFALNSQENRRFSYSANVSMRAMREIYLAAFEKPIREAKPWTVMCSYNRVNHVHASENKFLLTDILRKEWGFTGLVMSDWGAVSNRARGIDAGLDLEMPTSCGENDKKIVEAVRQGKLSEEALNEAVRNVLKLVKRARETVKTDNDVFDRDSDHEIARVIAQESMVLLKNENKVLPISKDAHVAAIGLYASKPRYQGGGSSHINSHKITSFMDAVAGMDNIMYAQGYDDINTEMNDDFLKEAIETAKKCEVSVIFAGLPTSYESEGYDRVHMKMPDYQISLIEEVSKVSKATVVLLHNGSAVEIPWENKVDAILECYLGGQAVGAAQYDILFGDVNPSGHLAETFPIKLEDNPSFINFPGNEDEVLYGEDIFVGYRYYDIKKMPVLYPFGHGLSYTSFEISNIKADTTEIVGGTSVHVDGLGDDELITVTVDVQNTGNVDGKEVLQLYVYNPLGRIVRPIKELRAFDKVTLKPGESRTVEFKLNRRCFAYYDERINDFYVPSGDYMIGIGDSSDNVSATLKVSINTNNILPKEYTYDSLVGDMLRDERISELVMKRFEEGGFINHEDEQSEVSRESITKEMTEANFAFSPLRSGLFFSNGKFLYNKIDALLEEVNNIIGKEE